MRHGWLVAIAVAYLYVFPYYPKIQSANELPRVYLVKAIVHDHTFAIDRGVRMWGGTADVSPYAGHQYSNKAPGASLIVVPVYAAVNLVAGEPSLAVTMWLCRVVSGIVPAILFFILLWGFLERFTPEPAVQRLVIVAYALGSMAMTFTILYFSHQLAAICIASAWILAIDVAAGRRGRFAMLAAGLLAGAAPLVDYQTAFAGVPVAIHVVVALVRARPGGSSRSPREVAQLLGLAAAGAAIPIAILLAYHAACFDSPFRTGYDVSTTFAHFHKQGFLGLSKLRSEALWGSLFAADHGLLVLSPWLLLAIPGGVVLWRRRTADDRATVLVGASIVIIFILFVSAIAMWRGGWGVGPRYITAMLPFTLPLVAAALGWAHARPRAWAWLGFACGAIVSAVAIYTLTAATFPYWPDSLKNPLYEVTFRLLGDGAVAPNPLRGPLGALSIVPYFAAVAALLGWAIARAASWRGLVLACVVGAAILGAFALVPGTGAHAERAYVRTVHPAVTR